MVVFFKDLDTVFQLPKTTYIGGKDKALPLREIISRLEGVYCGSIGAEYMHLHDLDQVNWIREKLETPGALQLGNDQKRLLLARLIQFLNQRNRQKKTQKHFIYSLLMHVFLQ